MPVDAPAFDPSAPFETIGGGGHPTFAAHGRPTLENFDPARVDHNAQGWDYLKQYPVEVEDAAKAYMGGGVMPTGNPRNQGIANVAKMAAQKVAADLGNPDLADDTLFSERRKMRTDLGSSSPNSIGGILSNGKSAFSHLANLSDKYAQLGNYGTGDTPAAGYLAEGANYVGNTLLASPHTLDKIQQVNDNALKYGQEATKFYAGSGGGEAERMAALKGVSPTHATSSEMAGFLQTEKELMMERLRQKEDQVRSTLGDHYLADHPVMTPDLQKTLGRIDANIAKLRGGAAAAPQTVAQPQAPGQGQQPSQAAAPPAPTAPPQSAPAPAPPQAPSFAPPPRPRVGEMRSGFMFLGGDPADQSRWQQVGVR